MTENIPTEIDALRAYVYDLQNRLREERANSHTLYSRTLSLADRCIVLKQQILDERYAICDDLLKLVHMLRGAEGSPARIEEIATELEILALKLVSGERSSGNKDTIWDLPIKESI